MNYLVMIINLFQSELHREMRKGQRVIERQREFSIHWFIFHMAKIAVVVPGQIREPGTVSGVPHK